jgi:hypothetical protein
MHGNTKLKFIDPCIANIFAEYNQQDATFHNLFISVRRCTCFRRVFRPSSGVQNCTYSVRYWSDQYSKLLQFWAPDDGRKNRLKHVERLTEINKFWNVASWWLHSVKKGRQCTHNCNIEARPGKYFRSGKAIIITYSECVFFALVIRHQMRKRLLLCGLYSYK